MLPDLSDEEKAVQDSDGSLDLTDPGTGNEYSGGVEVWGVFEIVWDPSTGEVAKVSRSGELAIRHYRVSYFLNPPWCDDCIDIQLTGSEMSLGTGQFDVTLKNPTSLWAYDVRGMLQISNGVTLELLNADGYTSLFENQDYQYPAPYITYADFLPDHAFSPGSSFTERFELKTNPGNIPVNFNFLVTAGHPAPAGDVSGIDGFMQSGQLHSGGGSANIRFSVEDLQDDISGVCLHAGPLGGGDVWLIESADRWAAILMNYSASPGIYELRVDAHSPNMQNAVTSHYYRAVVFHDFSAMRNELMVHINADRASYGLSFLQTDEYLDTVAQFHAQDMADLIFFDHVNLDGWTPWQRMAYYGIEFSSAGENIAVGYDTPSEVETAWMNSPGHKANIINGSFNKIGLGIVPAQSGDPYAPGYYWVQVFTD